MRPVRAVLVILSAFSCVASAQPARATDNCPDLEGKDAAAHLEYLRGDRSKLKPECAAAAMRYLGAKRFSQASAVLIQYLDYRTESPGKAPMIPIIYPAVDALHSLGKPVVPELVAAVANPDTTEAARQNAAWTIFFIYGLGNPDGIAALVSAAKAEVDPGASVRLMDQARRLAGRCPAESRNDCENAVLK